MIQANMAKKNAQRSSVHTQENAILVFFSLMVALLDEELMSFFFFFVPRSGTYEIARDLL